MPGQLTASPLQRTLWPFSRTQLLSLLVRIQQTDAGLVEIVTPLDSLPWLNKDFLGVQQLGQQCGANCITDCQLRKGESENGTGTCFEFSNNQNVLRPPNPALNQPDIYIYIWPQLVGWLGDYNAQAHCYVSLRYPSSQSAEVSPLLAIRMWRNLWPLHARPASMCLLLAPMVGAKSIGDQPDVRGPFKWPRHGHLGGHSYL